jgi:hypothetical protein
MRFQSLRLKRSAAYSGSSPGGNPVEKWWKNGCGPSKSKEKNSLRMFVEWKDKTAQEERMVIERLVFAARVENR